MAASISINMHDHAHSVNNIAVKNCGTVQVTGSGKPCTYTKHAGSHHTRYLALVTASACVVNPLRNVKQPPKAYNHTM